MKALGTEGERQARDLEIELTTARRRDRRDMRRHAETCGDMRRPCMTI